jgi:hypothetical protein
MPLLPITPNAGIKTNGTDYANKNAWIDSNLIRFENGYLKNVGGWSKLRETPVVGIPIGAFAYYTNDNKRVLAIGTRQKVYVNYDNQWFDITPSGFVGDASSSPLGYGAYTYGREDYGDARSQSGLGFITKPFSFDNFGQDLIFVCGSDPKLYKWQPDDGSGNQDAQAAQLTVLVSRSQGILVSNERHIFAFGDTNDPRLIRWSSRETSTTWAPQPTNTAGDLKVQSGGTVLGGIKYNSDILVFTDVGINKIYYTGAPFIYGIQDAGENCATVSMRTVVNAGNFIAWMADNSFYIYDGRVQKIKADVHDYVYDNIHQQYNSASCGGHNQQFSEIWWFFPSGTSTSPDKYVIWNYADNVWSVGQLDRSFWIDQGVFPYPISGDSLGNIYEHETNSLATSENIGEAFPFAKSGPIEIGLGDNLVHCKQIIPDSEANSLPGVTLGFSGRSTPLGPETDFGNFTFNSDGYTDARFTARQVSLKITGDTGQDFQLGNIRLDVKTKGKR